MAMRWASILASFALGLAASGCLGSAGAPRSSSSAPPPNAGGLRPQAYATFHIRGTYISSTNHFTGDIDRLRFTIHCRSPAEYARLQGRMSWQERLCTAIVDYRTQIPLQGSVCRCPASLARVDVRGTIRGRPVREILTPCLCADGRRAAADARVILRTRPQKTTAAA
jgi:hypothetical protein